MKRRTFLKGSLAVRHGGLWTVQASAGRKANVQLDRNQRAAARGKICYRAGVGVTLR